MTEAHNPQAHNPEGNHPKAYNAEAKSPEAHDPETGRWWRWERLSLLERVFAANTAVFVVAVALLAWTPVTVHRIATPGELVVLVVGLILMLAVDLWLLRRTFGPLRRLAATMGAVDPARPGRREIDVPTLITGGRHDEASPEQLREMHELISGSELAIFERSSHMAFAEERRRYMATLNRFMARVERAA